MRVVVFAWENNKKRRLACRDASSASLPLKVIRLKGFQNFVVNSCELVVTVLTVVIVVDG